MRIYVSSITLDAAALGGENPLPRFCDPVRDRPLTHDGTFSSEDERLFGFRTGKRVLPYSMQDRYTRDRSPRTIKTVALENENLKATFLPEYGARLYSLYDKRSGRELLYKNEMLQFGNLSQRNAWFSGGIEFNFGHYGHSALTCSPMFAARVEGPKYDFLRFYEFERLTGAFYCMDFHLPDGAKTLDMFVRLECPGATDAHDAGAKIRLPNTDGGDVRPASGRPTYWWTNAAVRQTPRCRVLSGADRVLLSLPRPYGSPDSVPCLSAGNMPALKIFDGDCSYPADIDFSCEYFFQNEEDCSPWEAVGYEDGRLFFEVSTQPLRYRKMFCWGKHPGGRRWQKFLNAPEDREYLEIQAGIAPTQLHGAILSEGQAVEFTQCFGECDLPEGCLDSEWRKAADIAKKTVHEHLSPRELRERHERYREWALLPTRESLHTGSGWGALECARIAEAGMAPPKGMCFPASSLGPEQLPWLALLSGGIFPEHGPENPAAWMVCFDTVDADETPDARRSASGWLALLEDSLELPCGRHWESLLHLGVMRMENAEPEKAREAWEQSVAMKPSAIAWRNLSQYHLRAGDVKRAISCMERAVLLPDAHDAAFCEEYLLLLTKDGQYRRAWDYFHSLEPGLRSCRAGITLCEAALELGENDYLEDFFNAEHAVIQEGESVLTDVWFSWQAQLRGEDEARTRAVLQMPPELDFRMFT